MIYHLECSDHGRNREYIPHLAAHARAVLEFGYRADLSALSEYRQFTRDLITKHRGGSYEVDSLFHGPDGTPYLHIEAKTLPRTVERIAAAIDQTRELAALPPTIAKAVEYVLDIRPRYLWLVGPGTIDPAAHVWEVRVRELGARFGRCPMVPRFPWA